MIFNTMNFNSMKRIVLALMLVSVGMVGVQAQLLYKISKDSTNLKPSYIMASNRLMNPMGVVSLSGELKEALTNTDQMYFEVNKAAYQETINDAKNWLTARLSSVCLLRLSRQSLMLSSRNTWRWISVVPMCRKSMVT